MGDDIGHRLDWSSLTREQDFSRTRRASEPLLPAPILPATRIGLLATTNESADAEGPASFGSKFGTSVEHRDHSNHDNHVDLRNPFAERVAAARGERPADELLATFSADAGFNPFKPVQHGEKHRDQVVRNVGEKHRDQVVRDVGDAFWVDLGQRSDRMPSRTAPGPSLPTQTRTPQRSQNTTPQRTLRKEESSVQGQSNQEAKPKPQPLDRALGLSSKATKEPHFSAPSKPPQASMETLDLCAKLVGGLADLVKARAEFYSKPELVALARILEAASGLSSLDYLAPVCRELSILLFRQLSLQSTESSHDIGEGEKVDVAMPGGLLLRCVEQHHLSKGIVSRAQSESARPAENKSSSTRSSAPRDVSPKQAALRPSPEVAKRLGQFNQEESSRPFEVAKHKFNYEEDFNKRESTIGDFHMPSQPSQEGKRAAQSNDDASSESSGLSDEDTMPRGKPIVQQHRRMSEDLGSSSSSTVRIANSNVQRMTRRHSWSTLGRNDDDLDTFIELERVVAESGGKESSRAWQELKLEKADNSSSQGWQALTLEEDNGSRGWQALKLDSGQAQAKKRVPSSSIEQREFKVIEQEKGTHQCSFPSGARDLSKSPRDAKQSEWCPREIWLVIQRCNPVPRGTVTVQALWFCDTENVPRFCARVPAREGPTAFWLGRQGTLHMDLGSTSGGSLGRLENWSVTLQVNHGGGKGADGQNMLGEVTLSKNELSISSHKLADDHGTAAKPPHKAPKSAVRTFTTSATDAINGAPPVITLASYWR